MLVDPLKRFEALEVVDVVIASEFSPHPDQLKGGPIPDKNCHPFVGAFFQKSLEELGFPGNRRYMVKIGFSDGSEA